MISKKFDFLLCLFIIETMIAQQIVLDNKLKIIIINQPQSTTTTAMVFVKAGSLYETKNINGISHFLEHLCFKGTTKRPNQLAIATELEKLGSEYNALTSHEYTAYFIKSQNKNLDKILDILADIYLNSLFNPQDIEMEKGPIIEEINMYEDIPMSKVQELFLALVYGDQPAGWPIAGTKENVLKINQEKILNYRQAHYSAQTTTIVIAGGFENKNIIQDIQNLFKNINTNPTIPKQQTIENQNKPQYKILNKKSDQTHLVLGFKTTNIFDDDKYALDLLANMLGGGMGSRLFQKIRTQLGIAYYIKSSTDFFTDHGLLTISAGIDGNKINDAINIILDECNSFKTNVPSSELQKAKEYTIGQLLLSLETSDEVSLYYGLQDAVGLPLMNPDELIQKINMVTEQNIQNVAKKYFTNDRLNLAVLGPLINQNFDGILKV
ncbi:MAG: M16 family metallopeptidase [Minisyncoccia bacterium]